MNTIGEALFKKESCDEQLLKPPEIRLIDEAARSASISRMLGIREDFDAALVKVLREGLEQDPVKAKLKYEKAVYAQSIRAIKMTAKVLPKDDDYKELAKSAFFARMIMRISSIATRVMLMHEYDYTEKIREIEFRADSSFSILQVYMTDTINKLSDGNVPSTGSASMLDYMREKMEKRYSDALLRSGLKSGEVALVEAD